MTSVHWPSSPGGPLRVLGRERASCCNQGRHCVSSKGAFSETASGAATEHFPGSVTHQRECVLQRGVALGRPASSDGACLWAACTWVFHSSCHQTMLRIACNTPQRLQGQLMCSDEYLWEFFELFWEGSLIEFLKGFFKFSGLE